jgi:hypothetical protein
MDAQVLIMQNAAQMPIPELERMVHELNALVMRRKTTDKQYRERFLLGKINTTVLDREKTARYKYLIYKHEYETISDKEHAELLLLTEEEEGIRVQRLTYLVELTQLKNIPLPQLMENLGLNRQPSKCFN